MTTIQLFTDGGAFKRGKVSISVGIMYINRKKILSFEKINFNKSSDFAELFAINKILSRTYGYCNQKKILSDDFHIEIYTDSLSSIDSILSENNKEHLTARDDLISEIKTKIIKLNGKVSFYHIKSHISGKNLKTAYKMFCKRNNVEIPFDDFVFIQQQNKKCDNIISKEYKKYNKQQRIKESINKLKEKELKRIEDFNIDAI